MLCLIQGAPFGESTQVPSLALRLGSKPRFAVFNQSCALTVLAGSGSSLLNTSQKCRKCPGSSAPSCRKWLRRSKRRKRPRSWPGSGTQRTKPASPSQRLNPGPGFLRSSATSRPSLKTWNGAPSPPGGFGACPNFGTPRITDCTEQGF